jgi:hypothetical protein
MTATDRKAETTAFIFLTPSSEVEILSLIILYFGGKKKGMSGLKLKIPDAVSGPGQESLKIRSAYPHSGRIDIGMEVDAGRLFQILVYDYADLFLTVVDQTERRDRPGLESEDSFQPLGRAEAEPVFSQFLGQLPEVGIFGVFEDDKVMPVSLFVAEEKILHVGTFDSLPVLFGLPHRKNRRMFVPGEGNSQFLKNVVDPDFFRRWAHSFFVMLVDFLR